MPPTMLHIGIPWIPDHFWLKLSHSEWKTLCFFPDTISCDTQEADFIDLSMASSNSIANVSLSLWPNRLRIVRSPLLLYKCRNVTHSKMCFGSFHSPFVIAWHNLVQLIVLGDKIFLTEGDLTLWSEVKGNRNRGDGIVVLSITVSSRSGGNGRSAISLKTVSTVLRRLMAASLILSFIAILYAAVMAVLVDKFLL